MLNVPDTRGDRNAMQPGCVGHFLGHRIADMVGHRRQTGAGHVVVNCAIPAAHRRCNDRCRRRPIEGLGKDPKLHHTAPETSDSRTAPPDFTDCAMAVIARTEALPSSMSAPAIGASLRMTSAKPRADAGKSVHRQRGTRVVVPVDSRKISTSLVL